MTAINLPIIAVLLNTLAAWGGHLDLGSIYPPVDNRSDTFHLYFGLMMSVGGAYDSSGMIPAVQVALDWINNSSLLSGFLPGYSLHYVFQNSKVNYSLQCKKHASVHTFFNVLKLKKK